MATDTYPCPYCQSICATKAEALRCWECDDPSLYDTRTRREIATIIGVTPPRISQIRGEYAITRKPRVTEKDVP